MAISVFDLFSIGIGPSSSHTVGPMRASRKFILALNEMGLLQNVGRVKVDLFGSLALTGIGHGTDVAVILGLTGERPSMVDPATCPQKIESIRTNKALSLIGKRQISFNEETDLLFQRKKQLPYHPNGMRFTSYDSQGTEIFSKVFYSVGGGFIVDHETASQDKHLGEEDTHKLPYFFDSGEGLLSLCAKNNMSIADIMIANELVWRNQGEITNSLHAILKVMDACVKKGMETEGILPGGLNLPRRAPGIWKNLESRPNSPFIEWVSMWAIAVNEENAAAGRVVTAPTNGSSGLIPAVIHYYEKFVPNATEEGKLTLLLTAGAIGILYKEGASISGAEMGCMGEVGVACSMAAAGLAAVLGGTPSQIENAAEIGMEHNLGLTCDPVKGLVQIPCIERNAQGAVEAINAAYLALQGNGAHRVSLDHVIATARQTGRDMQSMYKETSLGGLAVNVPEC